MASSKECASRALQGWSALLIFAAYASLSPVRSRAEQGKAQPARTDRHDLVALPLGLDLPHPPPTSPLQSRHHTSRIMSQLAARFAVPVGLGLMALQASLYDVPGGYRAVMFDRFAGVKDKVGCLLCCTPSCRSTNNHNPLTLFLDRPRMRALTSSCPGSSVPSSTMSASSPG